MAGLLFLIAIICLICCLIPANSLPKACRSRKYSYSKCERIWPSLTLILGIMVIIGGGVFVIFEVGRMQYKIEESICKFSILFDDLMNGNSKVTDQFTYS